MRVTWTSIDVVRFAVVGKAPGPPILWIGVMPKSLSGKDAHTAAVGCQKLLKSYKIVDVEVEFRESVFARSTRTRKLLKSVSSTNATAGTRTPLTPALGLQIAARATPYIEGTGALYISEGCDSNKLYILSARHVVFPPDSDAGNNKLYNRTDVNQPRHEILLPGPKAFQTLLESITDEIRGHHIMVDCYERQLNDRDFKLDSKDNNTEVQAKIEKERAAIKALHRFHAKTTKHWSNEGQRVIGHVAYSPPITTGTGAEEYTEDWALIELDNSKIDWNTFKGNVIDLGTEIPLYDFTSRIDPNPVASTSFKYPSNRLLRLQGVIEEDELHYPRMLDKDGEPCLIVNKNGCATGVTIGRATGAMSFVREYFSDDRWQTSMEWAILPYDHKSDVFSAPGDSGAIIVDGKGRTGGLLTGGTGLTESADITYASPFYWLLQRIKTHFPHAHLYYPTA